jgi:hypothetical protein
VATFLDPRFKIFFRMPEKVRNNYLKESKKLVKEYVLNSCINVSSTQSSQSSQSLNDDVEPSLKKRN